MKKWILTLALVTLFTVGASAFTDISDAEENRAASSLSSLGIVNGTSGGLYSPDGYLTRAEFCKMAVLLLGDKDYLSFKNYTLFPDVPYTNWAAAYINCAVKKRAILRGFSDGSFKPDQNITYAQAVTVALNSLGYKSEDIGAIWPQDYIAKAQEIGLLDGLRSFSPDAPATRGQTAVLLRNTLITKTKAGNLLLDDSFDTVTGNAILLATPQNDASVSENYAEFYIGSEKAVKKSENALMAPLIGTSGYLVTDAANPGLAKGFVCDSKKSVRSKVKKSYPAKLETYDGSFDIPDDAKVIASGNVSKYNEGWFDLSSDTPINIFYDSEGKISLVSVESADMSGTAYVFGTTSVAALPANSKVIKNGNPASAADVKQYDIVTYSNGTYYVSDKKLTGIFQKASPSFTHPSSVTVLGKEFSVTKEAAKYFSGVSYNDLVTLLFDPNMNVAAVYPAQKLQFEQIGILSSLNDSGAKVTLMSGINVELPVELSAYDYTRFNGASVPTIYKLEGKLVKVLQDRNGKMILLASETKQYVSGDWNISAGTLGAAKVLSGVRVFEQVDPSAPIIEVSASDIHIPVVKCDNIRRIFTDYAGRVTHIILGDVTGNGYEYGIFAAGNDSSGNTVTLQQSGGTKSYYSEKNGGNIGTPGEVAKGMENMKCYTNLPCKLLKFMGTVTLGDFDGAKGVTVSDGYIKLSDDVQVYSSEQKKFLTLSEAKANFTSFGIYSDRGLSEGGKVRIILVK